MCVSFNSKGPKILGLYAIWRIAQFFYERAFKDIKLKIKDLQKLDIQVNWPLKDVIR